MLLSSGVDEQAQSVLSVGAGINVGYFGNGHKNKSPVQQQVCSTGCAIHDRYFYERRSKRFVEMDKDSDRDDYRFSFA